MRNVLKLAVCLPLALTGCATNSGFLSSSPDAGEKIRGHVHGGQQPVVGSHVYLLAANTTGYGAASTSLLASNTAGSDSIGGYVLTDGNGYFSISGDYTCTPGEQVYIYALGGDPGAGVNSAAGFLATVGACPAGGNFASTVPFVFVNEVTTVASAYAFAGYATDATHVSSSGTTLALRGISNAFATSGSLVDQGSGVALATTPAGNGAVPQATINTLANILAACVNSSASNSEQCAILFALARQNGTTGTTPTDTATAAINMAHNPQLTAIFAVQSGVASPFQPDLATAPSDFTLSITYTGNGLTAPSGLAIDGDDSIFVASRTGNTVTKLSTVGSPIATSAVGASGLSGPSALVVGPTGNVWATNNTAVGGNYSVSELANDVTPVSTFNSADLNEPIDLAIDSNGNIFVANNGSSNVVKFANDGTPTTINGAAGGLVQAQGVAIDNQGHVFLPSLTSNALAEFGTDGTPISPNTGYTGGGLNSPVAVAVDQSVLWVANLSGNSLTQLFRSNGGIVNANGYTGGGLQAPQFLAVDGLGQVWVANNGSGAISGFTLAGGHITTDSGYQSGGAAHGHIVVDGSGNVWTTTPTADNVVEFVGLAAPVATPLGTTIGGLVGERP